jgi:hypothetical protein
MPTQGKSTPRTQISLDWSAWIEGQIGTWQQARLRQRPPTSPNGTADPTHWMDEQLSATASHVVSKKPESHQARPSGRPRKHNRERVKRLFDKVLKRLGKTEAAAQEMKDKHRVPRSSLFRILRELRTRGTS